MTIPASYISGLTLYAVPLTYIEHVLTLMGWVRITLLAIFGHENCEDTLSERLGRGRHPVLDVAGSRHLMISDSSVGQV